MNKAVNQAETEAAESLCLASITLPKGNPQQLRRIAIGELPEAVMLRKGGIRFRHYYISVHAIDRFVERCGKPVGEILLDLNDAVLACQERAKSAGARRVIRIADERGGYVLFSGNVYFIMNVDKETGIHVVSTVMTPVTMSR